MLAITNSLDNLHHIVNFRKQIATELQHIRYFYLAFLVGKGGSGRLGGGPG